MPLMPKRVKYRKTQRGSRKGTASRNLRIDFGEFGLQTLDQVDRLKPVGTGCNYFNFREVPEKIGEFITRKLFIVNDNRSDRSRRAVSHEAGIIAFRLLRRTRIGQS